MKFKKKVVLGVLCLGLSSFGVGCSEKTQEKSLKVEDTVSKLTLATTTSLEDTGFLEATLPKFEEENNIKVNVVAKGTGEALELGKNKDADILFVHAKSKEEDFIKEGFGDYRQEIMYNYFVLVGPKDDDNVKKIGKMDVLGALKYIKENNLTFLSRGDESGTHTKELSLWEKAGVKNEFANYKELGQGMGQTLTTANEMKGYTLTDIGTYLATKENNKDLDVVIDVDESLKNVYSIVTIKGLDKEKEEIANKLVEYYKSDEMKKEIEKYGVEKYNEPLFFNMEK